MLLLELISMPSKPSRHAALSRMSMDFARTFRLLLPRALVGDRACGSDRVCGLTNDDRFIADNWFQLRTFKLA